MGAILGQHARQSAHRVPSSGYVTGLPGRLRPIIVSLGSPRESPFRGGEHVCHQRLPRRGTYIRSAFPAEMVHISPIGLIPKGGQPGKFRLIVDLLYPHGASINNGIDPECVLCRTPRSTRLSEGFGSAGPGP